MEPRKLLIRKAALRDVRRRWRYLRDVRGEAFADRWMSTFLTWLNRQADLGAQIGTAHPRIAGIRTFSYKGQASILVQFADDSLAIVRIYYPGEDWQA